MPSRGPPIVPARRSPSRGHLAKGVAIEHTTSLCEIAWLGGFHSEQEGQSLRLQKHMSRALGDARLSQNRGAPGPHGETGTIAPSCVNVWQAKFADLSIALTETRTR